MSPGSRGAFDLKAEFPGGVVWVVSVKATRTPPPRIPSEKELTRLKISAGLRGATPVAALVVANSVEYFSVRAGRRINPPRAS